MAPEKKNGWVVYILRCADDTLYTGITNNIDRRLTEHNTSARGASYTRGRRPVTVVYTIESDDRSSASRLEAWIKAKDRKTKESIITHQTAVPTS